MEAAKLSRVLIDIAGLLVYSARASDPGGALAMARDLGTKYVCFKCGTKFYDLKKPVPACPKCGADQRDAPVAKSGSGRAARAAPAKEPEEAEVAATDDEEAEAEEEADDDED
jgi:uncharacterized protein (TIGR02300 family)